LEWSDTRVRCSACNTGYPLSDGHPNFLKKTLGLDIAPERDIIHSGLSHYLKFLKNRRLQRILAPVMFFKDSRGKALLNDLLKQSTRILNVGSGDTDLGENVLNIDVISGKGVDILAEAHRLPLADQYFDAVICMDVLEHVRDAEKTIGELDRVLQEGGRIFITVPFIQRFHPSPNDFRRYTFTGLRSLNTGWMAEKSGTWMGPACAIQEMLTNFCAILFSFGSPALNNAFLIIFRYLFYPLQLLDYFLCRYPNSVLMAMDFYALFEKRNEAATASKRRG